MEAKFVVAPCPFCGWLPELQPELQHGFFISCENAYCKVQPETKPSDTEEQAVDKWNQRNQFPNHAQNQ